MSDVMKNESVIVSDALIGTFDILGAEVIFAANEKESVKSVVTFLEKTISRSIQTPKDELLRLAKEKLKTDEFIKELIKRTSSYVYADTIVFMCDISELNGIKRLIAHDYFLSMTTEITRYMFTCGIPIRGCLSCGIVARYKNDSATIISGGAYVEAIRIADCLEFSGTVLTDKIYHAYNEILKNGELPLCHLVQLPCVVKDKSKKGCVTQDMWCLDWLDDTEFLKDHADVRQLIFNSFASHGKVVRDSVNNKIGNTENNIRLLISHRNESRSPCAALS